MKSFLLNILGNVQLLVILALLVVGVCVAVAFRLFSPPAGLRLLSAPTGLQSGTIRSGRFDRTYHVYVPSSYHADHPAPVLLAYHGFGGTGIAMHMTSGLDAVGDQYGALVVYPDAVPEARRAWALQCTTCTSGETYGDTLGVDDDKFAVDLIEELAQRYSIDRSRIYATGHSLGGSFVGVLACRHADQISGVAIVASLLVQEEEDTCLPARPIRYLLMIGSADPNVPWGGGGRYGYVGAEETARLWGERNGCTTPPHVESLPADGSAEQPATVWTYESCNNNAIMRLYRLEGAGHGWPLGPTVSVPEEIGRWLLGEK